MRKRKEEIGNAANFDCKNAISTIPMGLKCKT